MRGRGAHSHAMSRTGVANLNVWFESSATFRRTTAQGPLYMRVIPNETLGPRTISACRWRGFHLWCF